jgi:AbrB family looped-hinge helix DNA binding protein
MLLTVVAMVLFVGSRRKQMRWATKLTSRGQVTIPKAIRDELGLKPHDRIRFAVEDRRALFQKAYPSLEELAGSIPLLDGMSVDEAIDLAKDEHVQRFVEKMKKW